MFRKCVLSLCLLAALSTATADSPIEMLVYGNLRTAKDALAADAGSYRMRIRLYNVPTGGLPLWGRTYTQVAVNDKGFFLIKLDDSIKPNLEDGDPETSLKEVLLLAASVQLYVGIRVGEAEEITPRIRFAAQPRVLRAVYASTSDGVNDFTVSGDLTAQGLGKDEGSDPRYPDAAITAKALAVGGNLKVGGTLRMSDRLTAPNLSGLGQVPVGTIVMYVGDLAALPEEWKACDGTNGTPDLRGRFILGAGLNIPANQRGGADAVVLEEGHIPAHTHTLPVIFPGDMDGNPNGWRDTGKGGNYWRRRTYIEKMKTSAQSSATEAHNNLPPYRMLHYIMRVK